MKKFGVLCPVFSLPSKYGIGDFGQAAYDFVDFLHDEGYNLWEVLPLGKVNGTSPYSCLLVHGFDEMFVDLDDLVGRGLLTMAECERAQSTLFGQVDYLNKSKKEELFALAYDRADDKLLAKLQAFARANTYFIDYGYMMVLEKVYNASTWQQTPKKLWKRTSKDGAAFYKSHRKDIYRYVFYQYILSEQWKKLKAYAKAKRVEIVGDLPIYCDKSSLDVFINPEYFKLDKSYMPYVTGGCPSTHGEMAQDWGLCIYNWPKIKQDNYEYMVKRLTTPLNKYDYLRLDHFAGLVEYWENSHTSQPSGIKKGGGEKLFEKVTNLVYAKRFLIEDLYMPGDCPRVKEKFGLRGMSMMQYGFDTDQNNPHLPANVRRDCIYYLGNHDNNTFMGFLKSRSQEQIEQIKQRLASNVTSLEELQKDALNALAKSPSQMVVVQIQDLMMLDEKYRTNIPGVGGLSWTFRLDPSYEDKIKWHLCHK